MLQMRWTSPPTPVGIGDCGARGCGRTWFVLGGLLLSATMMVLGLESGNHPEHSADFTRTAGIWIVGLIVGIVLLVALNHRDAL